MNKRSKITLGILVIVLLGIIITEVVRPKPINWRPSYTLNSKIPFGCFVLYNELPNLFNDDEISVVDESVYDFMVKRDSSIPSNYILINDDVGFDKQEANKLLNYVAQGNNVFLAATYIGGSITDTLNLKLETNYSITEDTITTKFTHDTLKNKTFTFTRGTPKSYIKKLDTLNTTILGRTQFVLDNLITEGKEKNIDEAFFIKTKFGKGFFFISTIPSAFTNYYLLGGNEEFVTNSFSYLPNRTIYWDDYKKSGRSSITSPMRFVLNQPPLSWAYYLTISGLLLFVVFKAKREQRIIPIIEPLENSSVEFARTVGTLYHQNKDYKNLNTKKITYFLALLRKKFYINTTLLNENFIQQISSKSGVEIKQVKSLIEFINYLNKKKAHSENDTMELTKKINLFKQQYGG